MKEEYFTPEKIWCGKIVYVQFTLTSLPIHCVMLPCRIISINHPDKRVVELVPLNTSDIFVVGWDHLFDVIDEWGRMVKVAKN